MSPYFARHSVTSALFGITIGVWVVLELRQRTRGRRDGTRRDRGSHLVLGLLVAAAWLATSLSASHLPGDDIGGEPAAFVLGLVLAWAGIALRSWSFHTLGRYFTFRVETSADQPVISSGPYSALRHPSYSAIELILIGVSLLYGTWLGLGAMVVLPMVGLVNRIRVEEDALESDLGDAYRRYAAGRKRMIPGVW